MSYSGKTNKTVAKTKSESNLNRGGTSVYTDLAKMSDDERRLRKIVIENDPFLYKRLDFDNKDIQKYLEVALTLSELEDFISGEYIDYPEIEKLERSLQLAKKSRDLREAVNQLWSTTVFAKMSYVKLDVEELGVHASVGEGYLEFEFPFEMLSLSDLYITNLKKFTRVDQLVSARRAWTNIMSSALERIPIQYRKTIYNAEIRVNVLTNKRRMSDPDHFWMRPVIDSFVRFGIIGDDKPTSCEFSVHYEFGHREPFLNIQVGKSSKSGLPKLRDFNLKKVF